MKARWIPILFGLAFLVVIVICVSNTSFVAQDGKRYFTIEDDALISLRYAWNLAHGHGLVWNTGERVEGFTNPLWTLYAAGWALFISRRLLPLVIQLSGAACLLAQAFVLMRIVRVMMKERGRASPWREAVAFVLPFVYGPLVYWSLEGLEVCLVGFLISWAVLFYLKRGWLAMAVVLGLAFWTRPDTAIPAAMMMGLAGLDALSNRGLRRPWLKSCGWLAGMVALAFLAREIYYGHTWPNTYVLKMRGFPFMQRITLNGIGYITPFLWENALPLSLALLTLVWGWTRRRALFAAMILPMIAYAVYVGGDALPHWRFIAPYVPFLGLILLDDDCDVMQPSKYSCVPNMIMVTVSLSAWMAAAAKPIHQQLHSPQPFERANIETALELNRLLKPGATIGVLHAGSIPYYTDFNAYDFLGKCDWTVARLPPNLVDSPRWGGMRSVPGHNKYDLYASITRHKPTYVQSYWWGHDNVVDYVRGNYEFVPTAIRSPFTETWLLLRKNSPDVRWELIHTGTTKPSIASPVAPS